MFAHRGFRFAKRFFYFSDEPVEAKQLSIFHQNEKPAIANPTAAWATQTGKGLLFMTKRAEDKATPAGIFNLVGFEAPECKFKTATNTQIGRYHRPHQGGLQRVHLQGWRPEAHLPGLQHCRA